MSAASRRGLLAAVAAPAALVPVVGAPPALADADAVLLRLHDHACRAWREEREAMEAGWRAAEGQGGDVAQLADAVDSAFDRFEAAIDEMAARPAAGMPGLAAKAAAVALFVEHATSGLNEAEAELLASMAEDAARLLAPRASAGMFEALRRSDAALIEACDAWLEAGDQLQVASDDLAAGLDLVARRCAALATITGTRAFTRMGRTAKAMVLLKVTGGRDTPDARLAASVAGDAIGR
ncbi:hypothetical protein [Falsiroseomonas ponticola]|uniref:hypothetical protein n=1 Tax=Falsiroseomonas ponticola TaxID=2786951 RepID=UPI0019321965|nr:hypothetical protein [Roseomonas ponticola]